MGRVGGIAGHFIVLPRSRGMIASSSRRISSMRLRRSFVISSPSTGVAPLYQLMLSRTSPSAYSNLRARSFPELRDYASPILAWVMRIIYGYGDMMRHASKMDGRPSRSSPEATAYGCSVATPERFPSIFGPRSPHSSMNRRSSMALSPEAAKSAVLNPRRSSILGPQSSQRDRGSN